MPRPEPSGSVSFVTGVDRHQFDQLFLLMGSMGRYCPQVQLLVCDFGLTHQQRELLHRKGILLEMPAELGSYPHAWYYKAALGRYTARLHAAAVLWIDVDMIILTDIEPLIENLNASMENTGAFLAVASNETVGEQLAAVPAPRYASLAAALHPNTRYLNSGLFLCRSTRFLEDWYQLCATMPIEKLFEQNAFNLVALAEPDKVRIIDMLTWNMCGQHVREATIEQSGRDLIVTGPHGRTHVLHATANTRNDDVIARRLHLTTGNKVFRLTMKHFRSEALRDFQVGLVFDALAADLPLLTECGFATNT